MAKSFTKPTPDQVKAYAASINFELNGEQFCDYYEQAGWKIRPGLPMKDWMAAVRTWKHRQKDRIKPPNNLNPTSAKPMTLPTADEIMKQFEAKRTRGPLDTTQ